jgi:hypothetical protein
MVLKRSVLAGESGRWEERKARKEIGAGDGDGSFGFGFGLGLELEEV